jgi:ABC-2 type transport system permease protein
MNDTGMRPRRSAFGRLLLNEARLAWRVPFGLSMGLGLPILLLIIFGSIPVLRQASSDLGGSSYFILSFPVLIGMTVLSLCTIVLPRGLVGYRETGILRRISVTPVPPSWLLAAQIAVNLVMAVAGLAILTVVGVAAFSLQPPGSIPGFLLANLLTVSSLFAVGLCIAGLAKNSGVAAAVGGLLFYALLFFGGLWVPRPLMPAVLLSISNGTPLGASVDAIQRAMQGAFPSFQSILVLSAYTLVFGYLAVRFFKWE